MLQHTVRRPRIPDNILNLCKEGDKQVVENILTIAQEFVPTLDVTKATISVQNGGYTINLPSVSSNDSFSLRELLDLQNYSPARIQDVLVIQAQNKLCLQVHILEETTKLLATQMDIIRLCKRVRR